MRGVLTSQVPPRGGGDSSRKPAPDFFWNGTLLVAKEGGQRAKWEPTSPLGAARGWPRLPGLWPPGCAPLALLRPSIFYIFQKKIRRRIFRGFAAAMRRNLSRTNLELRRDDPVGETSLPKVEIVAIVITNTPLIGGDSSPSTIHQHHLISKP